MKQNTPSLRLGHLIAVVLLLLLFVLPLLAQDQDEYLPPDDLDLEQVAQMLDRVEYYAQECNRYKCPKLDCKTAKNLYEQIYRLRRVSQLYAFWISKIPGFPDSGRTGERYKKVTALYRRLDALLASKNSLKAGSYSFSSCVSKMSAACGTVEPNAEELNSVFVSVNGSLRRMSRRRADYEQVTFSSSGEPSEGTASYPEKWRKGVEATLGWLMKASRSFASFPFPEQDELWVELEGRSFLPGEKMEVRYSTTSCCSATLKLTVVSGDRTISSSTLTPDRSKWRSERREPESTVIAAPETAGEYELRLFDPEWPEDFVYTQFDVEASGPSLAGKWRTDDGLEVLISRDGNRFVGNITQLGRINETRKYWKFEAGGILWGIVPESAKDDGREIYTFYCAPDRPLDVKGAWHSAEISMESDDSFVVPSNFCQISPEQKMGFVRLWRVPSEHRTDLGAQPDGKGQDN